MCILFIILKFYFNQTIFFSNEKVSDINISVTNYWVTSGIKLYSSILTSNYREVNYIIYVEKIVEPRFMRPWVERCGFPITLLGNQKFSCHLLFQIKVYYIFFFILSVIVLHFFRLISSLIGSLDNVDNGSSNI